MRLPKIIQGGMGVGVSSWRLARAVSEAGQLGVVSGTALDQVLARRLQLGDPGGHIRRALDNFPFPAMAERVWKRFHIPGGKGPRQSFTRMPLHGKDNPRELIELCIAGNFVEVFLAKEGHGNPAGINYLEKIQPPHLPSIYGALLAGVDYVLMGAGIPLRLPGVLDRLSLHEQATYPLYVAGAGPDDDVTMTFNPAGYMEAPLPPLRRPMCLPIIASNTLALTLVRKANGRVDGFIIEGPTAGGHNAPPRGKMQLNEAGEPIYGDRDVVDLAKIRELGLPFWLAGGYGSSAKLHEALAEGAAGVQVGTAFAFCEESGLTNEYKQAVLASETVTVKTDPVASPTGFPFKVIQACETVADAQIYAQRPRICDLGYLREAYKTAGGAIGYRCAGEPVTVFVAKGGAAEDAAGRKCLCNSLMANIGLGQVRAGRHFEPGLLTAGDDAASVKRFLRDGRATYTAAEVVSDLLGG